MPPCDQDTLKRLIEDLLEGDFSAFRARAADEPAWARVAARLEQGDGGGGLSGWTVLEALVLSRQRVNRRARRGEMALSAAALLEGLLLAAEEG